MKESKSRIDLSKFLKNENQIVIINIFITMSIALISLLLLLKTDPSANVFYGDANSRIVQSALLLETTSYPQIFTELTWLPLPYLVVIPFCLSETLYQSGLAASIPNMILYLVIVFFITKTNFLITRKPLSALFLSLAITLNPNIIYLSTSAMSELSVLSTMAGFFYYFIKCIKEEKPDYLLKASIFLMLSTLSRYEAWPIVFLFAIFIFRYRFKYKLNNFQFFKLILISFSGIILWIIFQKAVNGSWFYFLNAEFFSTTWQSKFSSSGDVTKFNLLHSLQLFVVSYWNIFGISAFILLLTPFIFRLKLKQMNFLLLFILFIPIFNFIGIFSGLTEMSMSGLNYRYVILAVISINAILAYIITLIKNDKHQMAFVAIFSLLLLTQYAFNLNNPSENVAAYKEATVGYFGDRLPDYKECGLHLKNHNSGDILMLTGSGYSHRLIKFSGLPVKNFRIPNSEIGDISKINNSTLVFNKSGTRDAMRYFSIPEKIISSYSNRYKKVFENRYFLVFNRK
jgi:hypothetical protein